MGLTKSAIAASILLISIFTTFTHAAYAITGPTGGVQPRLEVRQLFRENPDQWDLYLLALRQFQGNQQSFITSWYQIMGIHGSPQIPWDGVKQTGSGVGYCTHSSNLFPCWHRPYLALFEQKLQQAAIYVAGQFPAGVTRNKYMSLAQTLRAPYWDWAAAPPNGNPTFPLIVSAMYVTVNTPSGSQTIINPLFRYDFHPVQANTFSPYGAPFNEWGITFRYPTKTSPGAVSQNNLAQAALDNNRVSQRQSLYNWFTLCPTYDEISNDQPSGSSSSCHISLESLHNNIHVWVGGGNDGHMTIVPVSAFDPTFMLHHAMVDRLFAMWQVLYPNSYISNEASQIDTFTISQGNIQGPNSPLTPFHKDTQGDFWTCASSRDTRTFGYVYPDSDGTASDVKGWVNALYGPSASATAGSAPARKRKMRRDSEPEAKKHKSASTSTISTTSTTIPGKTTSTSTISSAAAASSTDVLNTNLTGIATLPTGLTTASNGSTYQYITNVQTTRFQLNGSYLVYFFLGAPSSNSQVWSTAANMVGSYGVFSAPGMAMSKLVTTSTVPLTDALVDVVANRSSTWGVTFSGPALESLDPEEVTPFLQQNLEWRIAYPNGTVVDPDDVPNFKISVVSSTMSQVGENAQEFPEWSPFNVLTQITRGKKGGVSLLSQIDNLSKRDHLYEGVLHPTALH